MEHEIAKGLEIWGLQSLVDVCGSSAIVEQVEMTEGIVSG